MLNLEEKKQEEKMSEIKTIQKGDFAELDYTGRVKDADFIFDTTLPVENYHNPSKHGPVIVCVGDQNILKGLDRQLEGKETGKAYTAEVTPEDGFGKRNAKLLQLVPSSKFRNEKINPFPGLQVNIDGIFGVVKAVSGGRVIVDFNHPLAGRELVYDFKIRRIVTDDAEKAKAIARMVAGECEASINDQRDSALITTKKEIPKEMKDAVSEAVRKKIHSIRNIEFALSQ